MKRIAVAVMTAATLLGAVACNKAASPQVNKEEAQAQAAVQACAAKANFITKAGRTAFYGCLSQGRDKAAVQACATRALAKDGVLTKAARQRFEADLASCLIVSPSASPTGKGTKK